MTEYIQSGYVTTGFLDGDTPAYIDDGYIDSGYIEGDSSGVTIFFSSFVYLFSKPKTIKLQSFDYIFFAARELKKDVVIYLYDNQITLEPLRIVREKNT